MIRANKWSANRAEIQENRTERAQQALIDNSQGEAPITIFSQGESWTDSKVIELFTASDEDYNNPYLLAPEAAYIEEGNHHTQTHGSTDPLAGSRYLSKHAGGAQNITTGENAVTAGEIAGQIKDNTLNAAINIKNAVEEKGIATVITDTGKAIVDSVSDFASDCAQRGVKCAIPDSSVYGTPEQKALVDKLQGNRDAYLENTAQGVTNGILTATAPIGGAAGVAGKNLAKKIPEVIKGKDKIEASRIEMAETPEVDTPSQLRDNAVGKAPSKNTQGNNGSYEGDSEFSSPTRSVIDDNRPLTKEQLEAKNPDAVVTQGGGKYKETKQRLDANAEQNRITNASSNFSESARVKASDDKLSDPITDSSRLLEQKRDLDALINDSRASVVVDEASFVRYYVKKDENNNPVFDVNGNYVIDPKAKIPPGKYITFTKDVEGLSASKTKQKLTIESIPGQQGYEQYKGDNIRIDFDIDEPNRVLDIPQKSDYLNDIGGPRALGGARQRIPNQTIPIGSKNPTATRLDSVTTEKSPTGK